MAPLTSHELQVMATASEAVLAYLRGPDSGPQALVVVDFGAQAQTESLPPPATSALSGKTLLDRLDGTSHAPANGTLTVAAPPHSARVLALP